MITMMAVVMVMVTNATGHPPEVQVPLRTTEFTTLRLLKQARHGLHRRFREEPGTWHQQRKIHGEEGVIPAFIHTWTHTHM